MKRIMMSKYGFIRWPEANVEDDGNRFEGWRAGKAVRVTKLVSDGQAYLSISSDCGRGSLPFEIYSKLPYYNDANWRWNGVPVAGLSDKDLQDFYNACVEYEKAYLAAEASTVYPTLEEIKAQAQKVYALRYVELNKVEQMLAAHGIEAAAKLSAYEWAEVQKFTTYLLDEAARFNPDTYPQTVVGTAGSFDFVKPDSDKLEPSYWFERIRKLFEKVANN